MDYIINEKFSLREEKTNYKLIVDTLVPYHFKKLTGFESFTDIVKIHHPSVSVPLIRYIYLYRFLYRKFYLLSIDNRGYAKLAREFNQVCEIDLCDDPLVQILLGRWICLLMRLIFNQSFPKYKNYLYDFDIVITERSV